MPTRLSRRKLAIHAAERLLSGDESVLDELVAMLVVERRERETDLLVRDIEDELAKRGVVVAMVESAVKLSEAELAMVKGAVADQRSVVSVDEQSATRVSPAGYAREIQREACSTTDTTESDQATEPTIYLKESINPDLIGGVKITTPTQMLDGTIAKKLSDLRAKKL